MKYSISLAACLALFASPALAAGYTITPLVSDQAGVAQVQDPDLVNPWGLAQSFDGAPVWVSDNGTDKSTFYDRVTGNKQSPVVAVAGAPTGIVSVPSNVGFNVTKNGQSGHCSFAYDTESGLISCWAPSLDNFNAIVGYDGSAQKSAYKGIAIDTANQHLLTADFRNNRVQMIDTNWTEVGSFTDPSLPKNYAPFNVQVLGGKIYVAFAERAKHSIDERAGKHRGYVDVFDLSGNLLTHLIANGKLNAPWGLAIAPSSFGEFANALLVGNFGDGKINAYDPNTGDFLGTLKGTNGKPTVQFSAGPDDEAHGLLGSIKPN
jgi:uncharacterized protein (TIGR03118 family)